MNKLLLILKRNPRRLVNALLRRTLKAKVDVGKACITKAEIVCLQKYAKQAKLGIVEIGVLDGNTTREMALVASAPIYGIDPLIPDSMDKNLLGQEENIKKNLKFYKAFYFINDYGYNAAKKWNKPIDFLFIDGDHNYDAVKNDYTDWLALVSPNGFIAFHDSGPNGYEGPKQLVEELRNDTRVKYIETCDSLTVFQKI